MIYYINAFAIIIFFYLNHKSDLSNDENHGSNFAFVSVCVFGVLFSGLRYQVGGDWPTYQELFEKKISLDFEGGYIFLDNFLSKHGFSFEFLLLFVSCFYGLMCFSLFKLCSNKWLALIILNANLSSLYFGGNRQGIGQSLAVFATCILLRNFLKPVLNRNYLIIAGIILFIGASFHTSVVFFTIVLIASFLLRKQSSKIITFTVVFSIVTIVLGGQSPLAPIMIEISKMTGLRNLTEYVNNTEIGIADVDSTRDILIIVNNLILIYLMNFFLKFKFNSTPYLDSKTTNEYYGIIVNLIVIFYFVFCLYLGVARDFSGRLLLYGRFFEAIFYGGISLGYSHRKKIFSRGSVETSPITGSHRFKYYLIVNSIIILSLFKIYFTYINAREPPYVPYRTILFPSINFY